VVYLVPAHPKDGADWDSLFRGSAPPWPLENDYEWKRVVIFDAPGVYAISDESIARAEAEEAAAIRADDGFCAGTIAALAIVYSAGQEVTWGEIVRAADTQAILRHALTNEGYWEWAGFARLARRELGDDAVDTAMTATGVHK
jgi:hypothetical protein